MTQTSAAATKIMIIRHAEKPPANPPPSGVDINGGVDKDSLIVQGWQRAGALAVLFAPSRGPFQNSELATPQFIFASSSSDPEGNRPEETVTPLINKLKLTSNFHFAKKDVSDVSGVASAALSCVGVVLISWPHGMIPKLAKQIPLSPNNQQPIPTKWPGNRFDIVWIFDTDVKNPGRYIFSQVPQLLLAGDSSQII
jgi:hypothetical protein